MADALFEEPGLAAVYDPLDPDRSDLEVYAEIVSEFGARTVLDIGCGTGTFACLLASRGVEVVGVDPAAASLDVARAKPGAGRVRWIRAEAADLPPLQADLATMTGNVAQVFVTDREWDAALRSVHASLRPGGHLVFETRDPAARAWLEWDRARSLSRAEIPGVGVVRAWAEVSAVQGDLVSFRSTFIFEADHTTLTSGSVLRFRQREEVADSLRSAGFEVVDLRDAPDRPGRELVFIARRPAEPSSGNENSVRDSRSRQPLIRRTAAGLWVRSEIRGFWDSISRVISAC
jgi:SAM-dependent methyltransferase